MQVEAHTHEEGRAEDRLLATVAALCVTKRLPIWREGSQGPRDAVNVRHHSARVLLLGPLLDPLLDLPALCVSREQGSPPNE